MKQIHIGTLGWSYDLWRGNFYPEGTRSKDFLAEYSKQFDTVEIDGTFYRMPSEKSVQSWRDHTPENFVFSAKFPSRITHIKRLENCADDADRFIERMSFLSHKLGPLLIQLPPSFRRNRFEVLRDFLDVLPHNQRYVVELRNKEWFDESLFALLREYGVPLAIIDHPDMPLVEQVTAHFAYLRWEGKPRPLTRTAGEVEDDRSEDIRVWADEIHNLSKASEVFGYFSKYWAENDTSSWKHALTLKHELGLL